MEHSNFTRIRLYIGSIAFISAMVFGVSFFFSPGKMRLISGMIFLIFATVSLSMKVYEDFTKKS